MSAARNISLGVIPPSKISSGHSARKQIASDLAQLIEGEVRFERHDRMLYATDASIYQVEPIGVVCPRTIRDAEIVVRYCAEHALPLLPRGGGTSLAGQTVNEAIILDFSVHCRGILAIDAERQLARVEPGVVLDQLNDALKTKGLMFGPDVATSGHANIGGMIGNNSSGAHSILYGRTVEHLLGLDVLLADGSRLMLDEGAAGRDSRVREMTRRIAEVIRPIERAIDARFPKTLRRVNGYNLDLILKQLRDSTPGSFDQVNLAHLICGSEGTLAVVVEATLGLVPMPQRKGLAIIAFDGVDEALRAVQSILETQPAAVELIDDVVIDAARGNTEYRKYVDLLPQSAAGTTGAVLYVEYFADTADQLNRSFNELQNRHSASTIKRYSEPAAMGRAWKLRSAGEPLLHGLHGQRKPITFIEDTAVNPDRLVEFVSEFRHVVAKYGTTAAYYAHASVGCLHIRPMISLREPKDIRAMQAIAEEATDLVIRYGGALSGEHGDGRVRSHLLERFFGPEICGACAEIKKVFDPQGRLNPGIIVQPPADSMVTKLRVKPDQDDLEIPLVKTFFRYDREHGFGEAVEMCNGAGVCRKLQGGTMCPSYRATLDERHATRGRGNALRLAITGQFTSNNELRQPAWNDPETQHTLDLCLSCKACKTECPSNVDIAKLKAEYTAQGFERSGRIPLRVKAFGNIRSLNRIGSALHPLANALGRVGSIKAVCDRILGLHPKRELPCFGPSFYRWMKRRKRESPNAGAPAVILFPDCFTTYNEPRIAKAAVLTLEALGYRVTLPPARIGCCGRSFISTGMLAKAAKVCRSTAEALIQHVQRENAIAVVGCEPSCISAIKDEWLDLDMGIDPRSLCELAEKTSLIEQFIEARWDQHPRAAEFQNAPKSIATMPDRVLLHGHCHQKALWGIESSSGILHRLLGDRLEVLDSGCCGMAGSFGYSKSHYQISMKIGENSLFRAVREASGALVLAPGTSCRQQLHDGLQRQALHPIELIAQLIGAG